MQRSCLIFAYTACVHLPFASSIHSTPVAAENTCKPGRCQDERNGGNSGRVGFSLSDAARSLPGEVASYAVVTASGSASWHTTIALLDLCSCSSPADVQAARLPDDPSIDRRRLLATNTHGERLCAAGVRELRIGQHPL
jgi:hypothetical protein